MKLDRNINGDGRGKYGLVLNRKIEEITNHDGSGKAANKLFAVREAIATLEREGIIDWGDKPETEFFVMRLRDKYASGSLAQYAGAARADGEHEYGREVAHLALRAGGNNPFCKKPD